MKDLPSLSVLRSFEAAAKHQSFTLAAEELSVTQSAISRMVRELERSVGVELFRPAGRGVSLTDAGQNLYVELTGNLDQLRSTIRHAGAAGASGRILSLGVLPTFGALWLAPRLKRFRQRHPEIQLAIYSRAKPFDLQREGLDLAIHFGRKEWVGGELTELCPDDLVAVAAPDLLAETKLETLSDIERLPLLHLRTRMLAWQSYFADIGADPSVALQGTLFDQFSAMINAAVHSLGAAIVPTYLIETELKSGRLRCLGRPYSGGGMYYVVSPKGVRDQVSEVFTEWLVKEARASSSRRALQSFESLVFPDYSARL